MIEIIVLLSFLMLIYSFFGISLYLYISIVFIAILCIFIYMKEKDIKKMINEFHLHKSIYFSMMNEEKSVDKKISKYLANNGISWNSLLIGKGEELKPLWQNDYDKLYWAISDNSHKNNKFLFDAISGTYIEKFKVIKYNYFTIYGNMIILNMSLIFLKLIIDISTNNLVGFIFLLVYLFGFLLALYQLWLQIKDDRCLEILSFYVRSHFELCKPLLKEFNLSGNGDSYLKLLIEQQKNNKKNIAINNLVFLEAIDKNKGINNIDVSYIFLIVFSYIIYLVTIGGK